MLNEAFQAIAQTSAIPIPGDARRAREVYRYLQPDHLVVKPSLEHSISATKDASTATKLLHSLTPFVQLAALRCSAQRGFLNVTDRNTQYFLAEASNPAPGSLNADAFWREEGLLFTGQGVSKDGQICESTIRLDPTPPGTYAFLVIPDLSLDSRYSGMKIVNGPPYFRFYAGTPITTRNGINIGSLCVMDTTVRDRLTAEEQRSLGSLAEHVMSYLEINRDAIEGRRSKRMSDTLNHFIEGKSGFSEIKLPSNGQREHASKRRHRRFNPGDADLRGSSGSSADEEEEDTGRDQIGRNEYDEKGIESVLHNKVFARAANLLREAFELDEGGGVMFVGATKALRHEHGAGVTLHTASDAKCTNGEVDGEEEWPIPSPTHQISTTTTFDPILNVFTKDTENPSPLLALSNHDTPFAPESLLSDPKAAAFGQVDKDVLRKLFRKYPGGRLWIFDEIGLLSASDDEHKFTKKADRKEPTKLPNSSSWSRDEPTLLRNAFPGVRQLMFAPNWDAETSDWTSACFVWSRNNCVLTSATDLSFLNSFTKTVMAELSRLDAVLADKQKGDFIGSISHELRSPLHGILASAEFLGETPGTTFQRNLISTVDACGRTLLDTINHILDYSKINSFERNWQNMRRSKPKARRVQAGSIANPFERTLPSGAPPLLRMYDITDVAAITEEVVEAIAVGQLFNHATEICDVTPRNRGRGAGKGLRPRSCNLGGRGKGFDEAERVEVIIDIDREDWVFLTQPGALRRVIMNLVGNAIKYTTHGTIKIRLQLKNLDSADDESKMMILTVMDTGKGISPKFLSTMLFVPFAQENSLSPGTGLGLCIVRSIVTMLGGIVDLRSRQGEGTTVQVTLPLQRSSQSAQNTPRRDSQSPITPTGSYSSKDDSIKLLQRIWKGCKVAIYGLSAGAASSSKVESSRALARYITDWYSIEVVTLEGSMAPDIVIVEERDVHLLLECHPGTGTEAQNALLILCVNATRHSEAQADNFELPKESVVEFVSKPCGPYKLAKALLDCIRRLRASRSKSEVIVHCNGVSEEPSLQTNGVADHLKASNIGPSSLTDLATGCQTTDTAAVPQITQHEQIPFMALPSVSHMNCGQTTSLPFPNTSRNSGASSSNDTPISSTSSWVDTQIQGLSDLSVASPDSILDRSVLSPRVLLVDDNNINLSLLKAFMKKRKYELVDYAEDGSIAVNAIKAAAEPYDIIFMDISMPVMNGFEATRAIRHHESKSSPSSAAMIIALTGLASGRDQSEGFLAGFDVYMTKPVSFKDVGKLLDSWEAKRNSYSEGV